MSTPGDRARVGIDATTWHNQRGYGRFTRHAIGNLIALDPDTDYVFYAGPDADTAHFPSVSCRVLPTRQDAGRVLLRGGTRHPLDIARMTRAVLRDRLDAFLFPVVDGYFPLPGLPVIVGIHDSTGADLPRLVFSSRGAALLAAAKVRLAIRAAAVLFTVSQSARRAIAARLGVDERALAVVPEAPAPVFHPRNPAERARVLAGLGTLGSLGFFLYAGGINPHKNLGTLLDAYAEFRRLRPDSPDLVIVGALAGEYVSAVAAVRERIARADLAGRVHLPGFVSDEALACLYGEATAVVIPSLAEGFGLPPVEAAACGTAVIVSDLASHRESLGDAALYFPPTDRGALLTALLRVHDQPALRDDLASRAQEAVACLSWGQAGKRLRELVRSVTIREALT
jgi:glycosyltransferase involved in cell wall biosynthesis